jgi:hypothetical protein
MTLHILSLELLAFYFPLPRSTVINAMIISASSTINTYFITTTEVDSTPEFSPSAFATKSVELESLREREISKCPDGR